MRLRYLFLNYAYFFLKVSSWTFYSKKFNRPLLFFTLCIMKPDDILSSSYTIFNFSIKIKLFVSAVVISKCFSTTKVTKAFNCTPVIMMSNTIILGLPTISYYPYPIVGKVAMTISKHYMKGMSPAIMYRQCE